MTEIVAETNAPEWDDMIGIAMSGQPIHSRCAAQRRQIVAVVELVHCGASIAVDPDGRAAPPQQRFSSLPSGAKTRKRRCRSVARSSVTAF